MARQKKKQSSISFDAITVEGSLIAPAMVQQIASREAGNQTEADYRLPKGLTIRDEIARYFRIGQALFEGLANASATATIRFTEELFREVFGFTDITKPGTRSLEDRQYAVTLEALGGRVPILVVPPSDDLDRASDHILSDGRRRSASSAVQDWLNANDDALWGFCCNGERLRLVRDNASLTRPAYIEADLGQILGAGNFADFAALWLLVHATRFGNAGSNVSDCALERWREAGTKAGLAARERLREGVEDALIALGSGFLAANPDLRERVKSGQLPLTDYFGQLLRLIYRLIFLAVAEERNLLHTPQANVASRKLYAEGYAFSILKERAIRRSAWDQHHDRWQGLLILFNALHGGEKLLGLPALGGLFQPELMLDLLRSKLANRALMDAIFRLTWLRDNSVLMAINWRDMETEELGSVYESLLELTPRLSDDGRALSFAEGAETKGNARKTSGSYYTPDSLVQTLLDSALDPVLDEKERGSDDPAQALLTTAVIDPACGSGHFLLAAARRIASRVAHARSGGVPSAEDYRHALRDVVRNCIYGVDRNPMAVELTKVALWIETVEPGRPLGFLDANIRCGDSLLGVFDLNVLALGIPDEAYKPLTGDDKETSKYFSARNKAEKRGQGSFDFAGGGGKLPAPPPLAPDVKAIRALPEDSAEDIAEKKKRFTASEKDARRWAWRTACDLYVAAFLLPKKGGAPTNANTVTVPTSAHVWQAISGPTLNGQLVAVAQEAAMDSFAFHWPLEFPDVMAVGGFDCVLGNPPWEVVQLDEVEYFTQRLPDIAELPVVKRKAAIASLESERPENFVEYQKDKHYFEASNEFARASDRFVKTARGKINTFALFSEHFATLVGKTGRAGLIVPTGIATDSTTATFFASLVEERKLCFLFDFENRKAIFQTVHRSYKFCILVIGRNVEEPKFAFFLTDVMQLGEADRQFALSQKDISRINPNLKTAPVFRSKTDAELNAKIYSLSPVLINENTGSDGNPWTLSIYARFFNLTEDVHLFRKQSQFNVIGAVRQGRNYEVEVSTDNLKAGIWLALNEGEFGFQFDHRFATSTGTHVRSVNSMEKCDPNFEIEPTYWVHEEDFEVRWKRRKSNMRSHLVGVRRVSSGTNERTAVGTIIPFGPVTYGWILVLVQEAKVSLLLCANMNSIVFDYCLRNKLSQPSIPNGVLNQVPIITSDKYSILGEQFVLSRGLELTYTSNSLLPFARDLGYEGPPFIWDEDRRAQLRAELDAFYAKAYGLTRDELRYILDPADVMGEGYPSETFRVLKDKEIKQLGEYRTRRLVLEAWDKLERGEFGPLFQQTSTAVSQPIDHTTLPDGEWAPQPLSEASITAQLVAIIAKLPGPTSAAQVRLAVLYALEPRYLTARIDGANRTQWLRLCGTAAQLLPSGASAFAQPVNTVWGQAVAQLKGMRALVEDSNVQTWSAGPTIASFELGEDMPTTGRARFVLQVMAGMNIDQEIAALPAAERTWLAAYAA